MQKLVDVVIPMYNRAHCITGLIEELKSQTMQDFCAIFVDDGSTDNTRDVVRGFQEQDNGFKIKYIYWFD